MRVLWVEGVPGVPGERHSDFETVASEDVLGTHYRCDTCCGYIDSEGKEEDP